MKSKDMRWIDIGRISVRMLRTNGLRTLLTMLGIGVAISLIVLLIGIGFGLQNITVGSIIESKALLSLDIRPPDQESLPLTIKDVEIISAITGIREASPVVITDGELKLDDKLAAVAFEAAYPSYLDMQGVTVREGGDKYSEGATEIILTPRVLELLDLTEAGIVGTRASFTYSDPNNQNQSKKVEEVVIIGIADGVDAATVYAPYSLLSAGDTKLSAIKAIAKDRDSLVVARDAIAAKNYVVETLIETLDQARGVFNWVTFGLTVFGTIALVVAAIGMFNTLTISLLERTREIGIMKAIGVTDGAVKKLFLTEAGLIGFFGGLFGIVLGLIGDLIFSVILNRVAQNYGGIQLDLFQYPTGFLLTMVLYPTVLALVTGFYPAIRASRLNPLKALRYE